MSKRRTKARERARHAPRPERVAREPVDLRSRIDEAAKLIEDGRSREAVDLLEPLSEQYPRSAPLLHFLATAYVGMEDLWAALAGFERAHELSRDPDYWEPLARLYLHLELNVHALHAFRQCARSMSRVPRSSASPFQPEIGDVISFLEHKVTEIADRLHLPVRRAEEGLQHLEDGIQALQAGDYAACADASQRAIRLLGDWPPPHNNLSLALFYEGRPDEAIATACRVQAHDPANIQALSNVCRFLAWTGRAEEARAAWEQLARLSPADESEILKAAEAAAILEEDRAVHDLLLPLVQAEPGEVTTRLLPHARFLSAVAAANLGLPEARRQMEQVESTGTGQDVLLAALKAGKKGPGRSSRFPYFSINYMMPRSEMEKLIDLMRQRDELSEERFRRLVDRFLGRFPQAVLVAERLVLEEDDARAGISLLEAMGSPEAYAALRRIAFGQAGDDGLRIDALSTLVRAGQIAPNEQVRMWLEGEWREIRARVQTIAEHGMPRRDPQTAELLVRAFRAMEAGDDLAAESLFRRALEHDPRAVEALNSLGTIYARRGDDPEAKQMFRAALEIDPDYAFPRLNLAQHLLNEGKWQAAQEMLQPLEEQTHLRPQAAASLVLLRARIAVERGDHEGARSLLKVALQIAPDLKPAQAMLDWIERVLSGERLSGPWYEELRQQALVRRRRLQAKLSVREPGLAEALPLYSRDVLSDIGKLALPIGSWTGVRKADLLAKLVRVLQEPPAIDSVVAGLNEEDCRALRRVLAEGGQMPWAEFDAQFGNDLEESPYWHWHEPETTMGHLRRRALLVETTMDGQLLVAVPLELRRLLAERLGPL